MFNETDGLFQTKSSEVSWQWCEVLELLQHWTWNNLYERTTIEQPYWEGKTIILSQVMSSNTWEWSDTPQLFGHIFITFMKFNSHSGEDLLKEEILQGAYCFYTQPQYYIYIYICCYWSFTGSILFLHPTTVLYIYICCYLTFTGSILFFYTQPQYYIYIYICCYWTFTGSILFLHPTTVFRF